MGGHPKPPYTHERMSVLEEILAAKRAELALLQESEARGTLRRAALDAPPARDFASALRRADGRLAVVAEIKRRSPSKGDLAPGLDPAVVAKAYETSGAAALSVLTDRPFFGGSVDDLQGARAAVEIPALRKDFSIDETQVYESRAIGADAVLLIVAALTDDGLLTGLRELAEEIGIVALVEAHDDVELDRALAAGATVVGVNARDLAPLFPMGLIAQEVSTDQWIDIPGEVLDILRLWRPTPLVRAERLEAALGTPARIYYKDESISPAGSHKPNTAVVQAFYNKAEGVQRLTTETGAGQWGSALAYACAQFGIDCKVYMVRASYDQKPYRKILMETWGGEVVPSPVDQPDHPGSLGLAISDAVRDAASRDDSHYSLGSVLNHVLLHQTVIGLEAKEQLALAGDARPDVVVGCCGGGSNLSGIALPFVPDEDVRLVAAEPSSCPTLTEGAFDYDFGDTAGMTPLLAMYTLGHEFVPPPIHAGGLRYHGDAPIVSSLVRSGRMEAVAYPQGKTFEASIQFANAEGKIPAPETGHAIRAVIDEALAAKETGEERVIRLNFSGHGLLDLSAYDDYLHGRLIDA